MILLTLVTLLAAQQGPDGRWEGTLDTGQGKLRLALDISKAADGLLTGVLDSIDQGAKIPIDAIDWNGDKVRLELKLVKGTYEGTLNGDRTKMSGTWTQVVSLPLEFVRVAPGAAAPKPAAAAKPSGLAPPIELRTLAPPAAVVGNGKTHLVWELAVTNFSPRELLLQRIDVSGDGKALASFEGAELNRILMRPGSSSTDTRALGGGQVSLAFLWATIDGAAPASLRHKIVSNAGTVESGDVPVSAARPVVLGPPLKGGFWVAGNGPDNASIHRRAMLPLNGGVAIAQRFAIDWVRLGAKGKENKDHPAWGAEVIAVADGVIASVKDGVPENEPGIRSRAVPMTLDTLAGNYAVHDLGGGRFALYAHLQPGSLRVKPGDKVKRGQVLGLVGNSGNSTEPHLHFQVSNGAQPLTSEGVPYVFESFETEGQTRRSEIPMQNAQVKFP